MEVDRSRRVAAPRLPAIILSVLVASCASAPEAPTGAPGQSATAAGPAPAAQQPDGAKAEAAPAAEPAAKAETAPAPAAEAAGKAQEAPAKAAPAAVAAKPAPAKQDAAPRVVEKTVVAPEPAAKPVVEEVPASPYTIKITAALKDPSHPFYGIGHKTGFLANGIQGKDLIFVRGKTYTFKVDTGVQHDFYLSTSKVGWGAATYSQGVEGNFTYKGIVTITPTSATPTELYYACRNHKNMGGRIHVVNEGEEDKVVLTSVRDADTKPAMQKAAKPLDENRVKQKIAFAEMFINQSQAAKRITASNHPEANEIYQGARGKFLDAKDAFAKGQLEQSLALVDESLRLMSEASRHVPSQTKEEAERARFKEMMEGTRTFADSYQRNFKRLSKQNTAKNIVKLDMDKINAEMAKARQLADDNNYSGAIGVLTKTQTALTNALTEMLDDETMSYELVFETPKEEYEYELARYESYEELIPIAIEQRRPPPGTVNLMNKFVEKAKGIRDQAIPTAAKGDYKTAILMLQGATHNIQRALQVAGVR